MYSQYGIDSSSKIRLKNIVALLVKATRQREEVKAWDMWLVLFPKMTKETFINFNDYKEHLFKPSVKLTKKTSEEIMQEFEKVIKQHEALAK